MPKTRVSLPNRSGISFGVLLLAICVLVAVNSVITSLVYQVLEASGAQWVTNARLGQPLLFLLPLILLVLELILVSMVGRLIARRQSPAA